MQIPNYFFLLALSFASNFFSNQCFQPSPMPVSGDYAGSQFRGFNSLAPDSGEAALSPVSGLSESPPPSQLTADENGSFTRYTAPAPSQETDEEKDEIKDENPAAGADGLEKQVIRWCAVREEYEECQSLVSIFKEIDGYTWTCIEKDTTQQCLESIKKGESDIINLEAGMAYTAFTTYSMKAIANEVYCDQAQSYDAVVLVNRKTCQQKNDITLMDLKGYRSCHSGHSTAAGWNFPINHINKFFGSNKMNDQQITTNFFSKICAPSEFEHHGVCSGCGNENGTCDSYSNSLYSGHSGAFRCLVEELGDVAFVKGDTAMLYSSEGPYNQSWSTKSIRDFMYLCPKGGCREINGYPGSCSLGKVPANVIMSSNSIPNEKKSVILQTLTNATWRDARRSGENVSGYLLSPSMQQLSVVKKLTRLYLGNSASISQNIEELNTPKPKAALPTVHFVSVKSSSPCYQHPEFITILSIITAIILSVQQTHNFM